MNQRKMITFCGLMIVLVCHVGLCANVFAETALFPSFESIEPNVEFWKKIYSQYSSRQGVLHDSENLYIIYDVIDLKNPDDPGGQGYNRRQIKAAKSRYRSILLKLGQAATIAPSNAEERHVAELFGPGAKPAEFQRAAHRLRCQVGQKNRFRMGIIRSGAYLETIRNIFRHHGLPEELAYLPHVESSFNPEAYSKFGAAGAWQFTRSTGRQFMTVNYTLDERRDPIRSSHAAAKLLKYNYEKLQSWPLAVTAYNHGLSGMLRAQKKHGHYENVFKHYRGRTFGFASRNFYSEFLAAQAVVGNYQEHFGALTLDTPVKTTDITLAGYTSIPQLSQRLGLDLATLRQLNPALRQPVFTGRKYAPKGYRLHLPADGQRDWEGLMAAASEEIYKPDQKHSRLYRVSPGDTAGKIARFHGVSLQDLIAFNDLDPRATIYVDQNLRIPLPDDKSAKIARLEKTQAARKDRGDLVPIGPEARGRLPDDGRDDAARLLLASQMAGALQTPAPDTEPDPVTVHGIAEGAKPELAASAAAGRHHPVLKVPDGEGDQALMPTTVPEIDPGIGMVTGSFSFERIVQHRKVPVGVIRVEIEETLGHYAEWSGVRASELRRLNGIRYGHPIHLGQELKIPLHRVTKEAFEEIRFEYHKELVEDFFTAYRIETVQNYSIKKGDNIWNLSREEFELPLWLIRRYNNDVDLTALVPSQNLRIPIVERTT
jgi:membrane-bound lytic murein transglycosylase D